MKNPGISLVSQIIKSHIQEGRVPLRFFKKTPTKYREFFPNLTVKTTDFSLFLIWSRLVSYDIWRAWCNGSYTMMATPIRALDYPMVQLVR